MKSLYKLNEWGEQRSTGSGVIVRKDTLYYNSNVRRSACNYFKYTYYLALTLGKISVVGEYSSSKPLNCKRFFLKVYFL